MENCPNHDTCWDITASPDGFIYVGACMEHTAGGIAELVQFNTKTCELRTVANIGDVAGEKYGDTHAPQGKIHLSLCSTKSGIIYGATHCTTPPLMDKMWDPWAMFMDAKRCFRGAHFYRYDPVANDIVDFGIITPNEGVSVMILDEDRERFFAATFPKSHLYSWNMKGRDVIDFGRVSEHYILSLIKYLDGKIYFTDYYGRVICLDPMEMKLDFLNIKLPHPHYTDGMRNWMAHSIAASDGWIYAGMYSYNNLIRFRPTEGRIEVEDLGLGMEELGKDTSLDFAFTKGAPVGLILKDETIYFVQLVYFGPKEFRGSYVSSYNIKTGKKEYIGVLEDDGFKPLVWKGALGTDGKLYWADFDAIPPSLWSMSL
ncbi:MAG: hypothetical protein H5T85_09055 [Actinobacteria bacterium]|nr:hypothetical protein [Actinomycetota bacterium]